jgi:intermediate cleaving peptidase 55
VENAKGLFGADESYSSKCFPEISSEIVQRANRFGNLIYLSAPSKLMSSNLNPRRKLLVHRVWDGIGLSRETPLFRPLSAHVEAFRAVKSACEIQVMKTAANITSQAFLKLMTSCQLMKSESDLANEFEYVVRSRGAKGCAYVPVVAGGPNACILHYVKNDMALRDSEMILVDAGAVC